MIYIFISCYFLFFLGNTAGIGGYYGAAYALGNPISVALTKPISHVYTFLSKHTKPTSTTPTIPKAPPVSSSPQKSKTFPLKSNTTLKGSKTVPISKPTKRERQKVNSNLKSMSKTPTIYLDNTATTKQKELPQKSPTVSLFRDNKTAPKDTNAKAVSKSRALSLFLSNDATNKSSTIKKRVARIKSVPTKSLNKGEISPTQSFLDGLSSYGN